MSSPSDSRPGATRGVPTGPAFPALLRRPLHAWRSSVSLRVVVTTLALSLVVAGLVAGWASLNTWDSTHRKNPHADYVWSAAGGLR